MKLALLLLPVLFAAFAAAEDIAQLEQDQTANRDQVAGIQRERTAAWRELLTGPFQEGGGPADETARQLAAESKRLDMEGRARGEALKAEKDADELAALKIEVGALRRRRDAAESAYVARVKELAAKSPAGPPLIARVEKLDADLAHLQESWAVRRLQISALARAAEPVSPLPKDAVVIELALPDPPDAAARRARFAERNGAAHLETLAHDFFRLIDPQARGVAQAHGLYRAGKFAAALEAYRDYFFEKVSHPEQFGIAAEAFTDDSRQFMTLRQPPATWIADAMAGIANTTSHDLGEGYVLRARVGPPGAVHWAYVADQPVLKNGRLVWLEFQRRFVRALGNDGGYEGLRDVLLDAYILNGDQKHIERWAGYTDDWYLNAQRAVDASPHNLRWADPIISRLVCGQVSRLRFAAQRQPALARQMPAPTLARLLIRLQEEYLAPNILVSRTTRQNWNMMGLGFNIRNALLLPEFKPAQWAGREARRGIDNAYLFTILPDGGCIEYGDEGHQGVWRERVGGVLELLSRQRPGWATPAWQAELLDTFNQNARFWIRHLKPDGYQHRDGLRSAREAYVGGVQSVFGPQSLDTQAPWVCAEPEAKRMLDAAFHTGAGAPPRHLSDVSPFIGEFILRGGWTSNAPFFYMQAGRMPNSGAFDDATAFRVHNQGLNLLIASPFTVDGRLQNAHHGLVERIGSKSEFLVANDGRPAIGRWHSAPEFDFAEGLFAGVYGTVTGRPYRTTFQPGGNALRPRNAGAPAVTNVSVARQVLFIRDPACWIVIDRLRSPAPHRYEMGYDLFTPVAKLDWLRRARQPIPNAAHRVTIDATGRVVRTANPGWPNVALHHFTAARMDYSFDRNGHDLEHQTKGEIASAGQEWEHNRSELREAMAFSRRVNIGLDANGDATLVTLIAPAEPQPPAIEPIGAAGFLATFGPDTRVRLEGDRIIAVSVASPRGTWSVEIPADAASDRRFHAPIQPVRFAPATNVFIGHIDIAMHCETPGVEIRYTLDGSDPTPQSAVFKGALRLEQSARVKAIAMRPGLREIPWELAPGDVTIPTWAVFTKESPSPPVSAGAALPGLAWDYIEGNQFALAANSAWWPAKKSGVTTNLLDVSMRETTGAFGVRYAGFLTVPEEGVYTFHAPREFVMPDIEAGYDLRVLVDGREWDPAQRWHALGTWSISLGRGAHSFQVIYVDTRARPLKYETWRDWPNPAVLWDGLAPTLEISGPGLARQPVPSAWLCRAPGG